jgi:hypothetical protein
MTTPDARPAPLKLHILAHDEGEPTGYDSSILTVPDALYVTINGERVFLAREAAAFLRKLSERQAADLEERLHHAEWTITSDPEQVRTLGLMHDCAGCRLGVRKALAYLQENPDGEVAVGQLWWAAQ